MRNTLILLSLNLSFTLFSSVSLAQGSSDTCAKSRKSVCVISYPVVTFTDYQNKYENFYVSVSTTTEGLIASFASRGSINTPKDELVKTDAYIKVLKVANDLLDKKVCAAIVDQIALQ